ncbi:MAG: hypothetical protein E5V52_02075 [Mesorhizobium sp.]|uniref:DUF6894 family protein n=1 Tax=Mesorhizobium sp. M2A.F.Ca.ET.067.02.1.1 TaxID=2496749 RepID=UPI000FD2BBEF|nr:hypothetical protein [Mesorhizobium sp. M2A.F.Ca.ET.067.02.1.1]RUW81537.1 hypothetical protein EOA28_01020 [Mesorhizobium sp. M2A.F.Ca.ET.067.02.1.1]TIU58134.1 MAG: hypothetical protein E5W35_05935 [Mesorhizobium sp.]TIW88311.1 MAG: hypothetical protein E5V52_02075 [Mesorhizobium sp.]
MQKIDAVARKPGKHGPYKHAPMPRFYFDSNDGTVLTRDSEGLEFANADDARKALQHFLMSIVRNSRLPEDDERFAMWVILRDETGKPLTQAIAEFEIREISN